MSRLHIRHLKQTNMDFETLVVIQFNETAPEATKEWVLSRLIANQHQDQGGGLLARYDPDPEGHNTLLLVGATIERLLCGAEDLQIKKPYKREGKRELLLADIDQYDNSENLNNFLTKSEKQRIIWEEIQNLEPITDDYEIPGFPDKNITSQDTLLSLLQKLNVITNVFPLHDKENMKLIERDWFKSTSALFRKQDIHQIREYFGENVAYYFAFMEFYTNALIVPSVFALLVGLFFGYEFSKYSILCVFNVIWWTVFMERWKRLSNKLAYQWGTWEMNVLERQRPLFYGEIKRSTVTGAFEKHYPPWKRMMKKYLVSYPIVFLCLIVVIWIYFQYDRIQGKTNKKFPLDKETGSVSQKLIRLVPSAGYSVLIVFLNYFYTKLASMLTDFENHRVQSAYENNLTSKLFIFYFTNCFTCLFHEAFFNLDFDNVANLLVTFVVFNAILLKFTEQIGPYVLKRLKKNQFNRRLSNDNKLSEAVKQAKTLTPFDGTYADYVTVFEQFGYVSLFSAIFPWVTICALINNLFEIRADAFKYCHVYQRPFSQSSWNIGSWRHAFDILTSISIVTNTALIAIQSSVRKYFSSYSDIEYVLIFVAAEHILLAIRFIIDFAIPDTPEEVRRGKMKNIFESKEALKRERKRRAEGNKPQLEERLDKNLFT